MNTIVVADYDETWPATFEALHDRVWGAVGDIAESIEHVGSTAVPGLAAKPIIDMGVVLARAEDVAPAVERLATLGYVHRGDLGIEGREAFLNPPEPPEHHLYAYARGSAALRNHLVLRDYLRRNIDAAREYGELKKRLSAEHPNDIDAYVEGKTEFILSVLARSEFSAEELARIDEMNRR